MAITLAPVESSTDNDIYERFNRAKQDATLLSSPDQNQFMDVRLFPNTIQFKSIISHSFPFFSRQMEDQEGNAIHLPPAERQSLMLALAMHEKGKSALKRENYSEALVFFLDADCEYKSCNSKLLESVDNYALLNLDIAWCYLCLRSVTQLPDAEQRLTICEQNFKKSYGENLDRVVSLKGSSGNEKALVLRLHLLQGVLYFHQNRRSEALQMLSMAENELRSLKVNENSLMMLMEMGYTSAEARIGLRASSGNIEQAVSHIIQNRDARREARKRSKHERALADGIRTTTTSTTVDDESWVNPRSLSTLIEMGYSKDLARIALRRTKNDVSNAIMQLQDNVIDLHEELANDTTAKEKIIDEITKMGFDKEIVKIALQSVDEQTVDRIVEVLVKMQQDGSYNDSVATLLASGLDNVATACSSTQLLGNTNIEAVKENIQKHISKHVETKEAFDRFSDDVATDENEYLDLPLVQEEEILLEYKRFLSM